MPATAWCWVLTPQPLTATLLPEAAMHLHVRHLTQYRYQSPVVLAQHLAYLRPRELPGQQVCSHQLGIQPAPVLQDEMIDAFGNWRTFFSLQSPHEALDVTSDSVVKTDPTAALPDSPPWTQVRTEMHYHAKARYDPAAQFLFPSPYIPRDDKLAAYARRSFPPKRPFLQACAELMERIHQDFSYAASSTDVYTPVLHTLEQRRGVCQDFAHVMIGCLRSLGLPARYVSGYLLTQPVPGSGQPHNVGADASHAWVSVPCGAAWHDFDPTNCRGATQRPGEDYITLAVGRDFGDVSPLRGVIHGGAAHSLNVAVTVVGVDTSDTSDACVDAQVCGAYNLATGPQSSMTTPQTGDPAHDQRL